MINLQQTIMMSMNVWIPTPLYEILIGAIAWSLIIIATFWAPKMVDPENEYNCPLVILIRAILSTPLVFWSVEIINTISKMMIYEILSWGNWSYHLGALIILAFTAFIWLWGVGFSKPTGNSLIIIFSQISYSFYFLNTINPQEIGEKEIFFQPLLVLWEIALGISIFSIIGRKWILKTEIINPRPLWNISGKLKRFMGGKSRKTYFIIWLLIWIEVILKFEGLGLLYWL